ncbi:MAG: spondin domain-containing protein, partial [Methyloversatilis sp.]|nr:spondin domain-containing protein [Methyloversatilis sp.]
MFPSLLRTSRLAAAMTLFALGSSAQAALVDITVTVENLVPANGISFAPLHFGFNNGSFDAFNLGSVATDAIISVAEGGAGGAWQAAFAAADPMATRGTLG